MSARSHVHDRHPRGGRAGRHAESAVQQTFEHAVFLDRAATIIDEVGHLDRTDRDDAVFVVGPRRACVVGERWLGGGLARAVGAKGGLVRCGYGEGEVRMRTDSVRGDLVVDNLLAASSWILKEI